MFTWMVWSPDGMGSRTARSSRAGVSGVAEDGSSHQLRSRSMYSAVEAGISSSPGVGNIAVRRSMVDSWRDMISGGRMEAILLLRWAGIDRSNCKLWVSQNINV